MHLLVHHGVALAVVTSDDRQLILIEQQLREFIIFGPTDRIQRDAWIRDTREKYPGDDFGAGLCRHFRFGRALTKRSPVFAIIIR